MQILGAAVNGAAIILGGALGLLLRRGIPQRVGDAVMKGMALCVLLIGLDGALEGEKILVAILSMVLGPVAGTLLDLDLRINQLGQFLERRLNRGGNPAPFTDVR